MGPLGDVLMWFTTGSGRILAAALLCAVMWALKYIPMVEAKLLTTPRLRQLGMAVLALAPVVPMLLNGAPATEVWLTAAEAFLGAMGIHVGLKVLMGKVVGAVPAPAPVPAAPPPEAEKS